MPPAASHVVIVGAGPAGLATAACLKQRGVEALVLEAGPALGHAWRHHYDRLRLHTVKEQSHLPGVPFAAEVPRYPSRAEVVAYLETYAARFAIAPRTGEAVRSVRAAPAGGFAIETDPALYRARAVVLATGYNRLPNPDRLPAPTVSRRLSRARAGAQVAVGCAAFLCAYAVLQILHAAARDPGPVRALSPIPLFARFIASAACALPIGLGAGALAARARRRPRMLAALVAAAAALFVGTVTLFP